MRARELRGRRGWRWRTLQPRVARPLDERLDLDRNSAVPELELGISAVGVAKLAVLVGGSGGVSVEPREQFGDASSDDHVVEARERADTEHANHESSTAIDLPRAAADAVGRVRGEHETARCVPRPRGRTRA